jgi:hypothetical protein
MLFTLGLILPISYLPEAEGGPVQWYVLAVALPFLILYGHLNDRNPIHPSVPFWLGCGFMGYIVLGLSWAYSLDSLGLWFPFAWAMTFTLGSMYHSLRHLWLGLALGLTISTGFALAQAFGYFEILIPTATGYPGLLINPTVSSAVCALALLALSLERAWLWLPGPALGLILSGSRGGWLILAAGLVARYLGALTALILLLAAAIIFTYHPGLTDSIRLQIWVVAYRGLTLLGWGPGNFDLVFYRDAADVVMHPQFVHNDYLQLAFEFGIGAIPLLAVLTCGLLAHRSLYWPIVFATAALAAFWFPFYHPITALIAFAVLGNISRDYAAHPLRLPAALQRWSLQ